MTILEQPELDFDSVSAPIDGETKAVVESVAADLFGAWEWDEFVHAVNQVGRDCGGEVDPDHVRAWLSDANGVLTINPRRLSAFYSRAVAQKVLVFSHWGTNGDTKGRNKGKPAKQYRLREQAAA